MIYTFYSYKGGVGRSMALANAAEIFYRSGFKVLMVDFDLEAPGLERYFNNKDVVIQQEEILKSRGVIDLLTSYIELRGLPDLTPSSTDGKKINTDTESFPYLVEPIKSFVIDIYNKPENTGKLMLLPAGRRMGDEFTSYITKVRNFDWNEFYVKWDGELFFEWFRKELIKQADIVLIDSRTGVTEIGGVCAYHLADAVLLFIAPNQQNLDGALMMMNSLLNPELIEKGRQGRPLSLLPVPSRIDNNEKERLDKFGRDFDDKLADLGTLKRKFQDLYIPYQPYYSYEEEVATHVPAQTGALELTKAFEKLVVMMRDLAPQELMAESSKFDVFLAYNSEDHSFVKQIAEKLKSRGLKVWFDVEQIPSGRLFQDIIQETLFQAKSVAIFIGPRGLGKWQSVELRLFRSQSITLGIPTIPILLPNVHDIGEELLFLRELNWIKFTNIDDDAALTRLVWAITGTRPPDAIAEKIISKTNEGKVDKEKLFAIMSYLTESEIRNLTLRLAISYDRDIMGSTKSEKVRNLIEYLTVRDELDKFIKILKEKYPSRFRDFEN